MKTFLRKITITTLVILQAVLWKKVFVFFPDGVGLRNFAFTNFKSIGDFKLEDVTTKQYIELTTPITIQYFKVTITSGYDDNSGEDVFFTHLAEVGIY